MITASKLASGKGRLVSSFCVADYVIVEVGVVLHLHRIQAQADHALFGMIFGPVGAIAAEQVQHLGVGRYEASQQVGETAAMAPSSICTNKRGCW